MQFELKPVQRQTQQPLLNPEEAQADTSEDHYVISTALNEDNASNSEVHVFKLFVFLEFFGYLILKTFFGPISTYVFKRFIPNGAIISNNLQINEGKMRKFVWIMKAYCYITTIAYLNTTLRETISGGRTGYEYNSTSQLWLLVHTEISLCVLYAAYFASLTDTEITRLKTEACNETINIFDRVLNLIRLGKAKLYEIANVARSFPEIDTDNFYFVYPKESGDKIPEKLCPEPLTQSARQLNDIGIQDGLIVQCDKYATHIAEFGGYQQLDFRVKLIRYCSRGLVFMNAILPVVNNIYQIIADGNQFDHIAAFLIYSTQQVFYSYLLFRLAAVYDVLFLGLLLYYKKYLMLSLLGEVIKAKPEPGNEGLLYIPTTVPQNIENWLSLRKVLATINGQAFVVIDLNMSFVLLYTLLFIILYTLSSFQAGNEVFLLFQKFLKENPGVQAVITLTVVVISILLILDIALGILINRLFMYEKHEWILQETIITNIRVNHEMYSKLPDENVNRNKDTTYVTKMKEIKSLLGSRVKDNLYSYTKRIKDSIIMVIKALDHEEFFNPHTLLGIRTDVRLVVALGTAISAIGLSTIIRIAEGVVNG